MTLLHVIKFAEFDVHAALNDGRAALELPQAVVRTWLEQVTAQAIIDTMEISQPADTINYKMALSCHERFNDRINREQFHRFWNWTAVNPDQSPKNPHLQYLLSNIAKSILVIKDYPQWHLSDSLISQVLYTAHHAFICHQHGSAHISTLSGIEHLSRYHANATDQCQRALVQTLQNFEEDDPV